MAERLPTIDLKKALNSSRTATIEIQVVKRGDKATLMAFESDFTEDDKGASHPFGFQRAVARGTGQQIEALTPKILKDNPGTHLREPIEITDDFVQ